MLSLHVLQTLDGGLDGLEVGQHAAQPALVNEGHASALGFFSHQLTGLTLCTHHQDGAAVSSQLLGELLGFLEHRQGLFQVDDVDLVAGTEDERSHLGIPETSLVTEVDAGFQHLAHCYCHVNYLKGWV
ncbi:hypothetical protein SDC9_209979 [bioreactor metagenome]|uniref:Uncharacterized protein n=1 Tax=bioreactor metagenome TaxID=1076179 RepID=A0A645JG96_9ZZZZ